MTKVLVSVISGALLLTASVASAQAYYPSTSANCAGISRDLSVGSRGADVTTLQRLLVAQNYPGGGSWMVTGYFGAATAAAVRNYQTQHGIPTTGFVDSATRASMSACGSYAPVTPSYPSYPTYPTTPVYPVIPTYPTYPTGSAPYITSLSMISATQNTSVTVYGTNFQYGNTVVRIGSTNVALTNVSNTAATFAVPTLNPGTYQLYVVTNYGTSNAMTFTVSPSVPCSTYPYGNCGTCVTYPGYGYGVMGVNFGTQNCSGGPISLSYLSPSEGAVNSQVTIYGSGFSSTGNSVRFGQGIIANLNSFDGTSLTFTVPSQLTGYGSSQVYLATYYVSVTNATGNTSNALPFTVTSLLPAGTPSISGLSSPTSLAIYSSGNWTLTVNNFSNTSATVTVNWGDGTANSVQSVFGQGPSNLSFGHTYAQSGTYNVVFTAANQSGQSNVASATVTVSGSTSGTATLSYITPQSGRVGTQVLLIGSGFSPLENTVRFGIGGTQHVISQSGTTMYYTIPSYVSVCDLASGGCTSAAQLVMPGTYPIYVTNQNGTTSAINFTVIQ